MITVAETAHGERAIDRQAEILRGVFLRHLGGQFRELGPQFVETFARGRADRYHWRILEERAAHEFPSFQPGKLKQIAGRQIGLREDHHAFPYS